MVGCCVSVHVLSCALFQAKQLNNPACFAFPSSSFYFCEYFCYVHVVTPAPRYKLAAAMSGSVVGYWITWAVAGQRILHWTHDSWKMHTVAKSILPWHQRILDYLLLIGTLQRGETILSSWMHPSGLKRGWCTPIFDLFLPIPWECLFGCFQLVLPSWLSSSMPSLKLKLSCGIAPTVVCKGMKCMWMS